MNNCSLFDAELVGFLMKRKSMVFFPHELSPLFTWGDFSALTLITLASLTFHSCPSVYATEIGREIQNEHPGNALEAGTQASGLTGCIFLAFLLFKCS